MTTVIEPTTSPTSSIDEPIPDTQNEVTETVPQPTPLSETTPRITKKQYEEDYKWSRQLAVNKRLLPLWKEQRELEKTIEVWEELLKQKKKEHRFLTEVVIPDIAIAEWVEKWELDFGTKFSLKHDVKCAIAQKNEETAGKYLESDDVKHEWVKRLKVHPSTLKSYVKNHLIKISKCKEDGHEFGIEELEQSFKSIFGVYEVSTSVLKEPKEVGCEEVRMND